MSFALLTTAKRYVSEGSGETDPDKLTEIVNKIRQEWYSWYERLPLFRFAEECFEVQCYPERCLTPGCTDFYYGFSLPNEYAAVEALWIDGQRVEFFDRWRQWQYGMSPPCDCGLSAVEVGRYATERDLSPGISSRIAFTALDSRDKGKVIEIRGVTNLGRPFREKYTLDTVPQCTPELLCGISAMGGIVKDLTYGRVVIAEEGGRVLAMLNPQDAMPQFRRMKISGLPNDCNNVNVRVARRYAPVFDDRDVVETDNQRAWSAMARAQRLEDKPTKTREDLQSIAVDKATAEAMLRGENVREVGRSVQVDIRVPAPKIGRGAHGLWRNRGWR